MRFAFLLFWLFYAPYVCSIRLRDPASFNPARNLNIELDQPNYKWSEEWIEDMPIDHFSFADNRTFRLRYLINTDYFKPYGPIFFYTGNEGSIEGFATNTGLMWDIAAEFNAAIVFAEHRYYGKTQPFGNDSYACVGNLGYLSSEQALADFAYVIQFLRSQRLENACNSTVIAFGGSYGGMLAAWIRIKYPHLVEGSIAASAPVFWFPKTDVPEDVYDNIVTRSFVNSGCKTDAVLAAWSALEQLASSEEGRTYINSLFKLEQKSFLQKPDDVNFLKAFIRESFEAMAMVNYPYPSEFLAPLPGWPVKAACGFFNSSMEKSAEEHAFSMYSMVNLFYNFTGQKETLCVNIDVCDESAFGALGDPLGWPWQACTEMVMQLCGSGPPNDFFWKDCPFTIQGVVEECKKVFGKTGYTKQLTRPDWAILNYGSYYPSASNIIFSNGYLDPWSGGGWSLKPKTVGSLVSIIIEDGAHHYDLRGSHPKDTDAVKEARRLERMYIGKWIKDAKKRFIKMKEYNRHNTKSFREFNEISKFKHHKHGNIFGI